MIELGEVNWLCKGADLQCEDFELSNGDFVGLYLDCLDDGEDYTAFSGPIGIDTYVCRDSDLPSNLSISPKLMNACNQILRDQFSALGLSCGN